MIKIFTRFSFAIIVSIVALSNVNAQERPFITIWQTDNEGVTNDNQIEIPAYGNYAIEWEEVDNPTNNGTGSASGPIVLTFPTAGKYRVVLSGDLHGFRFLPDKRDNDKIIDLEQWGDIQWSVLRYAFYDCENFNISASDVPDLSQVANLSYMFARTEIFNSDISNWDVSNVTDMSYMFFASTRFDQELNNWNVENLTNAEGMFKSSSFNRPLNQWNVSSVTNMKSMFDNGITFNQDINNWNVSNVTNMEGMFHKAYDFNSNINNWDVSKVQNMNYMFKSAESFNQDLSNWDMSNVVEMDEIFRGAKSFNGDVSGWQLMSLEGLNQTFRNADSFNRNINDWNVSNTEYMYGVFISADVFNQPLNDWNTSNMDYMREVFSYATSFNQDISNWDVSNVTNMIEMFNQAANFNQKLSEWELNSIESDGLYNFFNDCGISLENYDATLMGWSNNSNLSSNVTVGASGMSYCAAFESRENLINDLGWTFFGDSLACELIVAAKYPTGTNAPVDTKIYLDFNDAIYPVNGELDLTKIRASVGDSPLTLSVNVVDSRLSIFSSTILPTNSEITITIDSLTVKNDYGLYNYPIKWSFTTGTKVLSNKVPSVFEKLKIYPNPFKESTNIQFEVKKHLKAEFFIYDAKGAIVRQRNNLRLNQGSNSLKVEKGNLPAGLYSFILRSSEGEIQSKFVIE